MSEAYETMLSDLSYGECAIISDARGGGYSLSFSGKCIDDFTELKLLYQHLAELMEKHKFWPEVYFINDHGNVSLLSFSYGKKKDLTPGYIKVHCVRSWV